MELCSIASGSSGNCIYAGTESSHLMIDAGISGKRIEAGLNSIGLKTAEMQARTFRSHFRSWRGSKKIWNSNLCHGRDH